MENIGQFIIFQAQDRTENPVCHFAFCQILMHCFPSHLSFDSSIQKACLLFHSSQHQKSELSFRFEHPKKTSFLFDSSNQRACLLFYSSIKKAKMGFFFDSIKKKRAFFSIPASKKSFLVDYSKQKACFLFRSSIKKEEFFSIPAS